MTENDSHDVYRRSLSMVCVVVDAEVDAEVIEHLIDAITAEISTTLSEKKSSRGLT